MKIKCIVVIINQDGENDLYPIIIDLPEHEIISQTHHQIAAIVAHNDGNEIVMVDTQPFVIDENDSCFIAFSALDWTYTNIISFDIFKKSLLTFIHKSV